jgi:guanylate kinase
MEDNGILVVISGFSGAGKGTVIRKLLSEYEGYSLSISATTRGMRQGEIDGKDYFFKSREDFLTMIENDELIEYAEYVGNYYGTPKAYVNERLEAHDNVILEIEIQGALNIKKKFKDAVLIFITPPSATVLHDRLVGRGTESADVIEKRLSRAYEEAETAKEYDYIVVNDDLDKCVSDIHGIIAAEKSRLSRNIHKVDIIKEELKAFRKEQ